VSPAASLALEFPLFPEEASSAAGGTDDLFFFLVGVSAFFTAAIFLALAYFSVKYRRRSAEEVPPQIQGKTWMELTWTFIPLAIAMVIFAWGARLFFDSRRPPEGAMEVHVVARQWMWKFQHPGGQMEIDRLHVPAGRPVKLLMTSQDVIHSLFIPAFRTKADVLPGRSNMNWFEATRPGRYRLFCTQYCGTGHSSMVGEVIVLEPAEFERWLAETTSGGNLASQGLKLFKHYGCNGCHRDDAQARAPSLVNLYGSVVRLADESAVPADGDYLRESILRPAARIVAGWAPIMPVFEGVIPEEELNSLIAYIASLSGEGVQRP
jgi:cytochrome c oxidase subunit II